MMILGYGVHSDDSKVVDRFPRDDPTMPDQAQKRQSGSTRVLPTPYSYSVIEYGLTSQPAIKKQTIRQPSKTPGHTVYFSFHFFTFLHFFSFFDACQQLDTTLVERQRIES